MAEIKAQLVKELREMTGAGMMECKKALSEAEGELDKAIDVLRTRGLAAAAKKAGRATNEGLVACQVSADQRSAAMTEVNCETDFVARNEVFAKLAEKITLAILVNDPSDLDNLGSLEIDGQSVERLIAEGIHTLGENIQVSRFVRLSADHGAIASYIHGGGRLGVLLELGFTRVQTVQAEQFTSLAKNLAMQIAATNPLEISRRDFSQDTIDRELSIYQAQVADSGKPANIIDKIVQGRLEKFYKENALLEQPYIKDTDISVQEYLQMVSKELGDDITAVGFRRYGLGGQ